MGMGMSLGCCCGGCTCPTNLRSFAAADGALLWEAGCFTALARSPDNTLWGFNVRKITTSDYRVRTSLPITVSAGAITSGGGWPTKTGTDPGTTTAIECDLIKVTSNGTKTVTKAAYWARAATTSTDEYTWYKNCPRIYPSSPGPRLYDATDSGVGRISTIAMPFATGPFPSPGTVYLNDPWEVTTTLKMTIPSQALVSASSSQWNFKQGGTTASWNLYATAATIQTALATLPGVNTVVVTGGPCCEADVDVHIEWTSSATTFSDAWIKSTTAIITSRIFWDWTTGTVSLISNSAGSVTSFTSDSLYVLRGTTQKRAWAASGSHSWNEVSTSNTWSNSSMASMTQTCERNKIGAGTTWDAVPISTSIFDCRDGTVLIGQTRGRVPVAEPSGNPAYSNATLLESTGALISLHDSRLNVMSISQLDTDDSIISVGSQYEYTYQGFDGVQPPTGNSYSSSLGTLHRNHDGYMFATGTGTLDTFAISAYTNDSNCSVTGSTIYTCDTFPLASSVGYDWNTTYTGTIHGTELRSSGNYLTCRWVDVAAGAIPASRRETWMFFAPSGIPLPPSDMEWRFTHNNGMTVEKATAWFAFTDTEATVEAELQLWYGDGVGYPGYPVIFISGTVSSNPIQDQPFFQYLPLAHVEIWNDVGGTVWAPRGRVLCVETRNATNPHTNALAAMSRTDGTILWQKDVGSKVSGATGNWGDDPTVGGLIAYSDSTQVVVATQCRAGS